jgi:hypothetical protein
MKLRRGSPGGGITEFVLDPFNSLNRAWAAIGDPQTGSSGSVWRTDNLDASAPTWTQVLSQAQITAAVGGTNPWVKRIRASSLQSGLIFIAVSTASGLRIGRSVDFGATWTWSPALGPTGDRAVALELSDHNANRLWTSIGLPGAKILVSNDMGATFTQIASFGDYQYITKRSRIA